MNGGGGGYQVPFPEPSSSPGYSAAPGTAPMHASFPPSMYGGGGPSMAWNPQQQQQQQPAMSMQQPGMQPYGMPQPPVGYAPVSYAGMAMGMGYHPVPPPAYAAQGYAAPTPYPMYGGAQAQAQMPMMQPPHMAMMGTAGMYPATGVAGSTAPYGYGTAAGMHGPPPAVPPPV